METAVAKFAVASLTEAAFTSRLVAKAFLTFFVTVTVIKLEGSSLLELFWFLSSGARTLARSFVVSHLIVVLMVENWAAKVRIIWKIGTIKAQKHRLNAENVYFYRLI
jgi:hypothetical protein